MSDSRVEICFTWKHYLLHFRGTSWTRKLNPCSIN